MAQSFDENYHFVHLIGQHKEVMEKSQLPSLRKKKEEAVEIVIEKWAKMSDTVLTHGALLKKINNLKTRAKAASAKKAALSSWQTKFLEIMKDTTDEITEIRISSNSIEVEGNASFDIDGTPDEVIIDGTGGTLDEVEVVNLVNQFETDQTKGLSNEQLQRVVLLRQIKVLELQHKKLELDIAGSDVPVLFDISSLNVSNLLPSNADE